MARLCDLCNLPDGWVAPTVSNEVGMSKKLAWKTAKRAEHDRLMAYLERERRRAMRRGGVGMGIERSRENVRRETMADAMPVLENGRRMFAIGKGQLQPKKAKNSVSREQAGTIGRKIVVKRFEGSRLTCVCKSLIY